MSSELRDARIGFIGCGAMAQALAGGLIAAGVAPAQIRAADPVAAQREGFAERLGVSVYAENADIVSESDTIVLAVKPSVVATVLDGLDGTPGLLEKLWISIAAGIPIARLASALPSGARIVRAMPNTPALVGAGASGLCTNSAASDNDRRLAQQLFEAVGTSWLTADERLLDAVTGLSGSGPAYVFLLLEALGDAGVRVGLPREAAVQLACQTVYGASKLALESDRQPADLRDQVSSPGGTTIAGLERLEAGGLRAAIYDAVEAATARARELALIRE